MSLEALATVRTATHFARDDYRCLSAADDECLQAYKLVYALTAEVESVCSSAVSIYTSL
ncbi:hypothetical protein DPMN_094215 [Dreissena polymorpha]|uniref:Uncharacterized protein n=1 Tax=Dreissena polymorpha TaxID=45954 RepID=A0A9D4R1N3_DREPO|nr:hypothetical protein DPMN_094215 [Dreissena polymorpha]